MAEVHLRGSPLVSTGRPVGVLPSSPVEVLLSSPAEAPLSILVGGPAY